MDLNDGSIQLRKKKKAAELIAKIRGGFRRGRVRPTARSITSLHRVSTVHHADHRKRFQTREQINAINSPHIG